jgi:Flp pilus assembly protein TadB
MSASFRSSTCGRAEDTPVPEDALREPRSYHDGVGLFILVLLLVLAAAAGVLGAILKATLVIVLSFVLTVIVVFWIGSWYLKRRVRGFQQDVERRFDAARRRRDAYDVPPSGSSPGQLGDGS